MRTYEGCTFISPPGGVGVVTSGDVTYRNCRFLQEDPMNISHNHTLSSWQAGAPIFDNNSLTTTGSSYPPITLNDITDIYANLTSYTHPSKEKEMTPIEKARQKLAEALAERLLATYQAEPWWDQEHDPNETLQWDRKDGQREVAIWDGNFWRCSNGHPYTTEKLIDYLVGIGLEDTDVSEVDWHDK